MANVIIAIHGLGNKPSKQLLEHWWKLAMTEGLRAKGKKTILPKFEMVYWADLLYDKPQSESEPDMDSPYFLNEKYEMSSFNEKHENHNIREKIIDFLNRQMNRIFLNEDLSLNYSFITDSIIRKYFKDLEIYYNGHSEDENADNDNKRDLIRQRLLVVLEKHKHDTIMLVSHSMGSIIAFDVLTFLAPHIKIHTFITIGSPLGLPVVVTKIALEQRTTMNDNSHHMQTPPGITTNWYNFSDIQDKVAFNYKLNDDFAENAYGVKPIDFLVENDYESNGKANPHKSYGYLRTAEFSEILDTFIAQNKMNIKDKIIQKTTNIMNRIKRIF